MLATTTILIIEDEHDIRVALRETLENAQFQVLSTAHGREGLEMLKRIPVPQLILLGLKLPIRGGEDFLKELQEIPSLRQIPVIVLSAHWETSEPPSGAICAIRKPVDSPRLIRTIQRHLVQPS